MMIFISFLQNEIIKYSDLLFPFTGKLNIEFYD